MNLYIETENGVTKNHPAFEDNLMQAFGKIPAQWEPFTRIEQPQLTETQLFEDPRRTYEKVNGVWADVFHIREMTAEEKEAARQTNIKTIQDSWANREQAENWAAWTFDEKTIKYVPPIPRPEPIEGVLVMWCGAESNWKVTPDRPSDSGQYKFDFFAWQWVAVVN